MVVLEQTRVRERDRVAQAPHPYEVFFASLMERRNTADEGPVVIKARERPWQQGRQGRSKYMLMDPVRKDTALRDWFVFMKDIQTHSGRHVHQGGLVIYVTRGTGHSILDGVRYDWKPGDLLVLPIKPGGVDHQHFNNDESGSCQWVAFIYIPWLHLTGSMMDQVEEQKGWRDLPAISWDV